MIDRLLWAGCFGILILSVGGVIWSQKKALDDHIKSQTALCQAVQAEQLQSIYSMTSLYNHYATTTEQSQSEKQIRSFSKEWDVFSISIFHRENQFTMKRFLEPNRKTRTQGFTNARQVILWMQNTFGDHPPAKTQSAFPTPFDSTVFYIPLSYSGLNVRSFALVDVRNELIPQKIGYNRLCDYTLLNSRGEKILSAGQGLENLPQGVVNQFKGFYGKLWITDTRDKDKFVLYEKDPKGFLFLHNIDLENFYTKRKSEYKKASVRISFLLFIWCLFVLYVYKSYSDPIDRFIESLSNIGKGKFKSLPRLFAKGEMGRLESAIVEMASNLESQWNEYGLKSSDGTSKPQQAVLQKVIYFNCKISGTLPFYNSRSIRSSLEFQTEIFDAFNNVITRHNGNFILAEKDTMCAYWSFTDSQINSASAVMAAIDLRKELIQVNQQRIKEGEHPIYIKMGLHLDKAFCAPIGPTEKKRFSIYGPAEYVSEAMITENSKTDLLISEELANQIEDYIIFEPFGSINPIPHRSPYKVFEVKGYINTNKKQVFVKSPYSSEPES